MTPTRRQLLHGIGAAVLVATTPTGVVRAGLREYRLVAAPAEAPLVGPPHPQTAVWAYNAAVPGPELRARQGERLRVVLENRLPQPTSIHWHGLRVPNAMDGVPGLTQPPVAPGESFTYEFDLLDAGTYWYHPHRASHEQVGRGLHGALVVEELAPPAVDRDVTWVLGDWRLDRAAQLTADFGNLHDIAHQGRIGNTVTVQGRVPERFAARAGERIRLRLVNAANARVFALAFSGHRPTVIALDGQPVAPHAPEGGRVLLAPGMRADLILDMTGAPGETHAVIDDHYPRQAYRLIDLAYDRDRLRLRPPETAVALAPNRPPEPDLNRAVRHEIVLEGGMMGGMARARLGGETLDARELFRRGKAWALNGVAAEHHGETPLLTLHRNQSCVLALVNDTAWEHPMHLHGHLFRVLTRNGRPTAHREWRDTVLLAPRERAEIAFVADNPGDWMLHCHVLEHQEGGMAALVRVA